MQIEPRRPAARAAGRLIFGRALLIIYFALSCGLATRAWGQESSTISIDNGVSFSITAHLGTPKETEQLRVEMFRASGDSFYRVFKDQTGLAVFAYELEVARTGTENEFRVTAKPAEDQFAARFPTADGGKPVPTLSALQNFVFHVGSSAEIGLFGLEGQGLKVTDVARVVEVPPGGGDASSLAGDQQSPLRFSGLRISIDGMPLKASFGAAIVGKFALIYLPGRGAYFFSAGPVGKLIKTGSIDHNHLRFTIDNETFDCVADKPILTGADTGEVWVYHDPNYAPSGNWTTPEHAERPAPDRPFAAAADSLQWWLQ